MGASSAGSLPSNITPHRTAGGGWLALRTDERSPTRPSPHLRSANSVVASSTPWNDTVVSYCPGAQLRSVLRLKT